jgi:hypothetical protein
MKLLNLEIQTSTVKMNEALKVLKGVHVINTHIVYRTY